ncbi:MAG: SGNH/GDSL hydrolase family protein [Nitrososphaerales archaeon]
MFGIAIFALVAIEIILSLTFYIRSFWLSPDPDYRIKADTFAGATWASQYYKEINELGLPRWSPYVYWRRKPRQDSLININSDGIRKTYNDEAAGASVQATKVFMFGGSTMWGAGARDDFTIPSFFAKIARSKGITCNVTNFGQPGYVSTQGVIELLLQLQNGNVPDVVIFYDGVNDTFAAFQQGVAGLPQNEFNREAEFNLLQRSELRSLAVQDVINQLSALRFINGMLDRFGARQDDTPFRPLEYAKPMTDKQALAQAVVEKYLSNITLVRALSKFYGFKCLFYWQPVIYLKQHLTSYERQAIELEYNFAGMKELYAETYAFLEKRGKELEGDFVFHNISSIFNQVHEPIYIDYCHVSEKGNSMIAEIVAGDFARLMNR